MMGDGISDTSAPLGVFAEAMHTPAVGQVWREVDPRFAKRLVKIRAIEGEYAKISTVGGNPNRILRAKLLRFNGKRGGYQLEIGFVE